MPLTTPQQQGVRRLTDQALDGSWIRSGSARRRVGAGTVSAILPIRFRKAFGVSAKIRLPRASAQRRLLRAS